MLPDLIDKSFFLLNMGYGRGLSHTLLFLLISYVITYFSSRKNAFIANSLTIGIFFHLLLDLPDVPLLYPFLDYVYIDPEDPLNYWFQKLITDPVVQTTEIIGLIGFGYIIIRYKLYSVRKIYQFLKVTTPLPDLDVK